MSKQIRSVLITDLDDTLWSWLHIWYASFKPTLHEVTRILDLGEAEIISLIKKIHEKAQTSEYNFLLYDLEKEITGNTNTDHVRKKYHRVFEAQKYARKNAMSAFPDVKSALKKIKSEGTIIVGYTESMAYAAMDKIKLFELDGLLDVLYSREDHDIPEELNLDKYRSRPYNQYFLEHTEHKTLPKDARKPDPDTLLTIVQNLGADLHDCVYVGDKLLKDVKMAQDTGILDVYAKYGNSINSVEYDLLKKVTHWSKSAVKNEAETDEASTSPTITLETTFSDIFSFIDFESFDKRAIK